MMKSLLHATVTLALAHSALAEVKVTLGDINDKRTTGKFFAGLEIEVKLSGPELATAKGIRTTVKSATDDAGKALPEPENRFGSKSAFEELQKGFGGGFGDDKADEFQVKLEFGNPPRSAKAVKEITGSIELLIPAKDPAAIITASVAKDAGKPLDNAVLKEAGVEFTLNTPGAPGKKENAFGLGGGGGENDIGYEIKDPKSKVASVEFFDASGKKLESNGRMSSGFGDSKAVTTTFNAKPPADAVVKIYVVTEKSVVTVPLVLKDIALP